jgi:hypothetical protein
MCGVAGAYDHTALEARPGTDNRELTQVARNIAATRI